jgi:ABC-2 type transport system ATP-binding protein
VFLAVGVGELVEGGSGSCGLEGRGLELSADGSELVYTYDTRAQRTGITTLLKDLSAAGITFRDLNTTQSSLEDIFVNLVRRSK